ncbi:MAG: hypothetical protein COB53_04105 [Elusimicrobia bacterium]|nr:MAG: hypothetical protein COB53_04105 [Elusimicrobiota bacterium]
MFIFSHRNLCPAASCIFVLALLFPGAANAGKVSQYKFKKTIQRSRVWHSVEIEKRDVLNGPAGKGSYQLGQTVPCKYEEKDPNNPLGGHSPKFPCWDASGTRLKVKYDPKANPEVFGEIAGTRLFWALGFYAEKMYSVNIKCRNCPTDPWNDKGKQPRATRSFDPATLQTRLVGENIYMTQWHGWAYKELRWVKEKSGGSSKAEIEAFKLLAVFVNHGDNTSNQNRIVCFPGDEGCKSPILMVTDLGSTFGGQGGTNFRHWEKRKIWKDADACIANLESTDDDFDDPVIKESGRKFLSELLSRLSDKQIGDIFRSARMDVLGQQLPKIRIKGKARRVAVRDWVRVFKRRRKEISSAKCPS